MAQWLRALGALLKDLGSIPNNYTVTHDSITPVLGIWHPQLASEGLHTIKEGMHTHTQTKMPIYTENQNQNHCWNHHHQNLIKATTTKRTKDKTKQKLPPKTFKALAAIAQFHSAYSPLYSENLTIV